MKNTIKLLFLGLFLFGITATRAQISTSTGGVANVLPNAPTTNTNVGIGTTNPSEKFEVVGNIKASGTATFASTITAPRLISNVATGTSPLSVTSTTVVPNLNADLLDGLHASSFQTVLTNPITGLLTSGIVPVATGSNTLANGIIYDNGSVVAIKTAGNPYLNIANATEFLNIGILSTGSFLNSSRDLTFYTNNSYTPLRLDATNIIFPYAPTASAGTYDILTRNTSTGVVEKKASSFFQTALTNPITGTGLTNYLPKFTGASTLGNSILSDSGSFVNLQTASTPYLRVSDGVGFVNYGILTTSGNSAFFNTDTYYSFFTNSGEKMRLTNAGNLQLYLTPTTSAGTYDILTRNTSTGAVEKVSSSSAFSEYLKCSDGPRNLTDRLPNTFARSVHYDFVTAATTSSSGNYAGVMTYNNWDGTTSSTGDSSYQLAYVNESGINGAGIPGLKIRKGIDTTWGNWYSIITNNATTTTANYVPRFSGTNGILNSSIYDNGNVGIGSTNPDQKLTVKGKIHAEEIIVDLAVPADYVFQKYYTGKSELKSDYVMPTLAEIESFTKKNNHLPNVPSAQEIQQKGLSLGEMSNALLQKVEELTLYAIEQQKEIDRLKTENETYKSLAERLSAIEIELKK
jgi:hypothetical protein